MTVTVEDRKHARLASVETRLAGSNPAATPQGVDPLAARANYLLGSDPKQWRTGVPLYQRALYRNVYPGIDLVFHGSSGALEYDFVVRPGANAGPIALELDGAAGLRLDTDGSLLISTGAGPIRWKAPDIYQWKDGVRQGVDGRFAIRGRRVSFDLGEYDKARELVIDPTLLYATYQGGSDNDSGRGVAVDSTGNIYITGFSFSLNLPHTGGSLQSSYHGDSNGYDVGGDAFVAKYNSSGALIYVTYLGGSADDAGTAIAADSSGNAYVTGFTSSSNFPTTTGAYQTKLGGSSSNYGMGTVGDAFVAKINPAGTALVFSTLLGGGAADIGAAIAVDSAGDVYVGGTTLSTNFPTQGAYQKAFAGTGGNPSLCSGCSGPLFNSGDGFVAKLNPAGSSLLWSTYLGGTNDDAVTSLAIDSAGAVYVGGTTISTNFPTQNAYQTKYGGGANVNTVQPVLTTGDGFVTKFDTNGALVYSTYLGGSSDDAVMGIAVDNTGAAYVAGFTSSTNLAASGVVHGAYKGPATLAQNRGFLWGDAFVAKLAPSGGSLVYATYIGGSLDDAAMSIAVDSAGEAIVGGFSNSVDMTVSSDAQQRTYGGTRNYGDDTGDAFLARISADGSTVAYNSYYGGSYDDAITGVAIDPTTGNVVVVGSTTSRNLPVSGNAAQPTFGGESSATTTEALGDAFLAIFSGVIPVGGPSPVITSVVNAASRDTRFSPGTAAVVTGTNLPSSASAGATVGGVAAQVVTVSATQWSIVIPAVATGPSTVQIGTSAGFAVTISAYAPALYSTTSDGKGVVVATRGATQISTSNPALPGDTIVLSGTGFGSGTVSAPVTVLLAGVSSTASSVTASGTAPGTFLITFVVPATVPAGSQSVSVAISGNSSETLTLPVGAVASTGPVITAVQNGASYVDGFPVGAWLQIKGTNLATVSLDTWANSIVGGALPTKLDNVTVTVGGQPAYVYVVTPGQINVVAPNVAPGSTTVVVTNSLGTSAPFSTTGLAVQPGFFPWPGGYAVASHNADYTYAVKNGTFAGLTTVPAKPGEVLILWGTGFGPTTPTAPTGVQIPGTSTYLTTTLPTVTIGGQAVQVYAAALAPGFASLYQVAILVPNLPSGDYPVVATVNGVSSVGTTMLTILQ